MLIERKTVSVNICRRNLIYGGSMMAIADCRHEFRGCRPPKGRRNTTVSVRSMSKFISNKKFLLKKHTSTIQKTYFYTKQDTTNKNFKQAAKLKKKEHFLRNFLIVLT